MSCAVFFLRRARRALRACRVETRSRLRLEGRPVSRARHTANSRGSRSRLARTPFRRVRGARWSPRRHRVPGAPFARGGERQARRGGHRRGPVLRLHADAALRRVPDVLAHGDRPAVPGSALRRGRAGCAEENASPRTGTRTRSTCRTSCRRATCPRAGTSTAKTPSGFCGSSPGTLGHPRL